MGLHSDSLTYSATSLAVRLMHAVFSFFYVKIYTQRFHVTQTWFQAAQIVFMVWNAVNDPLFGYLQDNYDAACVRTRRHSVLYGAPLFAISFLVLWFPWADYESGAAPDWICGVQLMFGLCFYDTLFTFCLLAFSALFTEMSTAQAARIRLIRYSQVASLIGSGSVFLVNYTSHNTDDYASFLTTNVGLAVAACAFMVYTGLYSKTQYDNASDHDKALVRRENSEIGMLQLMLQLLRQRDFLAFVGVNFLHMYHGTFLANFVGVFCDRLVSAEYLTSTQRSVYYGALFLMPQVVIILGAPIVQRVGYFRITRASFRLKIALGCAMYLVGLRPYVLLIFFMIEKIGEGGVGVLFSLPISDIIDQDMEVNRRRRPISSMVYGTNALVTKPAHSLAPMLTVFVLSFAGYEQGQHRGGGGGGGGPLATNATNVAGHLADSGASDALSSTMLHLACVTPVVTGLLQLLLWSRYTIRDSHEAVAKYVET